MKAIEAIGAVVIGGLAIMVWSRSKSGTSITLGPSTTTIAGGDIFSDSVLSLAASDLFGGGGLPTTARDLESIRTTGKNTRGDYATIDGTGIFNSASIWQMYVNWGRGANDPKNPFTTREWATPVSEFYHSP